MTTIFAVILMIAVIIAALLIAVSLRHYYRQTKTEGLPAGFISAATAFRLSITKQEVVGNRVIGIDDRNNKLLFLEMMGNKHEGYLISLDEIKRCSVTKEYGAIHADGINSSNLESFVNTIALKLDYKNGTEPTVLTFYDSAKNPEREMRERAEQAKAWQAVLNAALAQITSRPKQYKRSFKEPEAITDFVF